MQKLKEISKWDYYNDYGCNYLYVFMERNPEFDTSEFLDFVERENRGDRDSGELSDIAKHEVLRLAHDFMERIWRFPEMRSEDYSK